jgi:16S rRNA G966 N2-methylase RsmD
LCYASAQMDWKNKLYFGDNLGIRREHVATESVDLIYLDPPFNSSAMHSFSVEALYERRFVFEEKGRRSQTAATTTVVTGFRNPLQAARRSTCFTTL